MLLKIMKTMHKILLMIMIFCTRYGKVFKTSVLGRLTVFMTGSEASKILLTGKDGMVSLNLSYAGRQVLGPTSLLHQNGEAHKRLRRLIAEPLSINGLKKYFQFIDNLASDTLDKWHGREILVLEEASTVKFMLLGDVILSQVKSVLLKMLQPVKFCSSPSR